MNDLFGHQGPDIDAQIREVKRELGKRRHVYPRLVDQGQLTRAKSDQQIRDMEAVQTTLEQVKALGGIDPLVLAYRGLPA